MKVILFLFVSLFLFSCRTTKENDINNIIVNNEKVVKNDSIIDSLLVVDLDKDDDGVLDINDECPEIFAANELGCPEVNYIVTNEQIIKNVDKKDVIKQIEKHEKKTNLKVFDATSKLKENDTTSGWIAYSVPEEMKVAKTYSVKVRISKKSGSQTKADLILGSADAINNPSLPSVATIEDVKVSGEMSAELISDVESFDINTLSTSIQNIDNESYTEWEWIVTPKKSGDSPLKLIIRVKDLNKDIVVFNKNIKIEKNVTVAVEGFFQKYWQWFITTIIIPIFIYFWNRKKKKQNKKELD